MTARADLTKPHDEITAELTRHLRSNLTYRLDTNFAKVDRIDWRAISDAQQAVNALQKGEIDYIEQPSHDLLGTLKKDTNISIVEVPQIKAQYVFRPNHLHKPFDNPKIRQAVFYALNQNDFLVAGYTNPKFFKECRALFICGTPLATDKGFEDKLTSDFAKSKQILKEEGYDGTPIVLLYATDTNTGRLTPILKALLER